MRLVETNGKCCLVALLGLPSLNLVTKWISLKLDSNRRFFSPCDLEIWWMTLKNNSAPLLCYIKLCATFPNHRWIQTGGTIRKRSNRVKICDFLSCVTFKFDGWPWKTIEHHFYVASSFVHHLSHQWIQTKVEVARFCFKIFQSCTLKYDRRGLAALLLCHMSNFQAIGDFEISSISLFLLVENK